jgi:hypothetical protein
MFTQGGAHAIIFSSCSYPAICDETTGWKEKPRGDIFIYNALIVNNSKDNFGSSEIPLWSETSPFREIRA